MAVNRLPEDGELQLAAVGLPPGRRIHASLSSGGPVAWATTEPVPAARYAHQDGRRPFPIGALEHAADSWSRPGSVSLTVRLDPLQGAPKRQHNPL